jgi:hypothetical protein
VSCGLEPAAGSGDPADRLLPARPEVLAAELWDRFRQLRAAGFRPLWQLDGRPMSGDVGGGTAHVAVRLLRRVAAQAPPGPLQLAGGTNARTLALVERAGVPAVAGVAFGGVARSLLQPLLLQAQAGGLRLLEDPALRGQALAIARGLVDPWLQRGEGEPAAFAL